MTDDTAKRLEEIERREQARSHAAWPPWKDVAFLLGLPFVMFALPLMVVAVAAVYGGCP